MKRHPCASLLCLFAALALAGSARAQGRGPIHATTDPVPDPGDFDVIVVVLDDHGTEKAGKLFADGTYAPIFGQLTDTLQPSCDQLWSLWSEGIRFDNAWVAPLCSPTRAAMLTGRFPSFNGIGHIVPHGNCEDGPVYQPHSSVLFLPALLDQGQALQSNGVDYASAAFGKWHLSEFDCDPIARGFDLFQGHQQNNGGPFPCDFGLGGERSHFYWRRIDCSSSFSGGCTPSGKSCEPTCCWEVVGDGSDPAYWSAKVTTDDTLAWIGSLPSTTPYFAWVAYNPPHLPLQVPPPANYGREVQAWLDVYGYETADGAQGQGGPNAAFHRHLVHGAMIEAVDRQLGRFLAPGGLSQQRRERAVVIVMGDNGSDMNTVQPGEINGEAVPAGHGKRSVYELGVRVPLVVRLPPSWAEAFSFDVADGFVHAVDLWRTVAQITGLNEATIGALAAQHLDPDGREVDSLSFLPLLHDPTDTPARAVTYTEGFLFNGVPHHPPRNQAIERRFVPPEGGATHRYKYQRTYDGSAGRDWSCLIATGSEGFYDLDTNPLEDPAFNLLDTSDATLVAILDALRTEMDGIYAVDVCPDEALDPLSTQ